MSAHERARRHAETTGRRRLFIYYRVDASRAHAAIDAATRMQASLRTRHPGLQAQLMQRADDADPNPTLMETYAIDSHASPAGIDAALAADIERHAATALAAWIVGARHVEAFDACA